MQGANLNSVHLEGADLLWVRLQDANLFNAYLEGANLGWARLSRASLTNAHLDRADLRRAYLNEASLFEAHLEGVDLHGAHLEGADLRHADLSNANVTGVIYDRRTIRFQGIRVATCYGSPLFKRDAQDQDWIETFRRQSFRHYFLYLVWAIFTDCGRSLFRVALLGACLAVLFGKVYEENPQLLDVAGAQTPWTPYYYSIVTFTTLGFGDVTPATFEGQLWVGAEVLVSYVMLGLLVSILANKVARRS